VLNYGLPALSGRLVSGLDLTELERALRDAILAFEPRILPDTLQVTGIPAQDPHRHHNVITMQISGQLWAQPYPLELLIKTDLNLESGEVQLAEGS
jgi:type VI secretion system protein ImpF